MTAQPQIGVPATYMRGGTSKGVFFRLEDLPSDCQVAGPARDKLFQRVIGSPDPYGKHTDGMGGATSSTSKCVIVSPASQPGHDVDYLYGQVAIDTDFVDWSGNCGNLTTAAAAFAIHAGYVDAAAHEENGLCTVRIWQANIGKTIIAHVPVKDGAVVEDGDFWLDGVTFPAAEIVLEFVDPAQEGEDGEGSALFPTGHVVDRLAVPNELVAGGLLEVTLINAGIPTLFVRAKDLGFEGTELQGAINENPVVLARLEALRAIGAVKMGLIKRVEDAVTRQHTPKITFVAPPKPHVTSSGKTLQAADVDLLVRALSMGKMHHAMMGTAAVAIGAAAAVPGTLVNEAAGGGARQSVTFGHPSGTLRVGAEAIEGQGGWTIAKAIMSRSARRLMVGAVYIPA